MSDFTKFLGVLSLVLSASGCAQTSHPVTPSTLGKPGQLAQVEAHLAEPGPIRFEKVRAASWEVPLGGLLNLDHPHARAAQLEDKPEPVEIYFYALEHPTRGTYLVDSGVARSFALRSADMPVSWLVRQAMNLDALQVHVDTKTWIARRPGGVQGILLTHLHLDHIMGLQDIDKRVPLFVGPGEADDSRFLYLLAGPTTNPNLRPFGPLQEFHVSAPNQGGVVDIFGDGSLFGLHRPGHTRGSMAYLVRTTAGPKLLTGDCSHTAWGWDHDVEPGSFNSDGAEAAESLASLRRLVHDHPEIEIHLGHQSLAHQSNH